MPEGGPARSRAACRCEQGLLLRGRPERAVDPPRRLLRFQRIQPLAIQTLPNPRPLAAWRQGQRHRLIAFRTKALLGAGHTCLPALAHVISSSAVVGRMITSKIQAGQSTRRSSCRALLARQTIAATLGKTRWGGVSYVAGAPDSTGGIGPIDRDASRLHRVSGRIVAARPNAVEKAVESEIDRDCPVESYLIAKSSKEQVGYKPVPDILTGTRLTCGARNERPGRR